MAKAIRIHAYGGPDMMHWEDVPMPEPGAAEALVHHTAIGLNYIDVYFRTGLYKAPSLPATLGMEAAGIVHAIGTDVRNIAVGDRVAYASGPIGAYATDRVISADRLIKLPDSINDRTAAAMMLQGMTAQYLLRRTHIVKPGETVLIHAAAGGVGLILCQWARYLGATVIGVVSSDKKTQVVRECGASHVIVGYDRLSAEIKRLTAGAMVPVVYDSVGKDTFSASLDCLAPFGTMVSFGNSSGPVPPIDIGVLGAKGSLYLTRPSLATYTALRSDLMASAQDLIQVVSSGVVQIRVNQTFPLSAAAKAHRALEARQTTGCTVLMP